MSDIGKVVKKILAGGALCAVAAGGLTLTGVTGYSYFFTDTRQVTITDAQMTKVDHKFMIATDYRPFQNHDAWYRGKFNSGTVQNEAIRLKGKKAEITYYGWRIPIFSTYEHIVGIKEVKD